MKAVMLLDGGKAKVGRSELSKTLTKAGIEVVEKRADFGVVVGGDGRFSRYGRTEEIPLLFVGVRSKRPTGSKAFLARALHDELPRVLDEIVAGRYRIERHRRLEVLMNGKSLGEVFTDAYLQRGAESACIRYRLRVRGEGVSIDEAAIGDGVIFATPSGATGYYSYLDRIEGESLNPRGYARMARNRFGVCHVIPTYTERSGSNEHPLRYTLPWGCIVDISLFRPADARLYGTTDGRGGVKVSMGDRITIRPGRKVTRIITLRKPMTE